MRKEKGFAVVLVLLAIVVAGIMIRLGKKNPESRPHTTAPAVRVLSVTPGRVQAQISATAVVEANQALSLTPEINGRVAWISSKMVKGSIVKKGEVLVKLDDRDHKLNVKQSRVRVESAQLDIDQEKARGEIAREEWKILGDKNEAPDLVLRVRQKEVAQLNLLSAKSALEKAELALSRTVIRAPFNAMITDKNIALGQVVSMQTMMARMLEKGDMLAEVSIALEQLTWIDIPKDGSKNKGSRAILIQKIGNGVTLERDAYVASLIGEIDQQTRRARLLLRIPESDANKLPLLPGAFVEATILGKEVTNALELPRESIVEGNKAWMVKADSTLQQFSLERLWGSSTSLFARASINGKIMLAVFLPEAPVNGMKVTPLRSGGTDE